MNSNLTLNADRSMAEAEDSRLILGRSSIAKSTAPRVFTNDTQNAVCHLRGSPRFLSFRVITILKCTAQDFLYRLFLISESGVSG